MSRVMPLRASLRRLALVVALAARALAAIPSPESHFGHPMGAEPHRSRLGPRGLLFPALEQSSPRIRVQELGKTTEGRPLIAVTIAAPATLRNLDRYAWIQKKLADPCLTPQAEAETLIAEGRAVVSRHLLDSRDRTRLHPCRHRVRLPSAHPGHAALPRHPR